MLCRACENAFREDCEDVDEPVYMSSAASDRKIPHSPFFKASHHTIPELQQSASDGCRLCICLWEAAPSEARDLCHEAAVNNNSVRWLSCYITVDRAVFGPRQIRGRYLVEYKYKTIVRDPKDYVAPFKKHFRLLRNEDAELLAKEDTIGSNTWSEESWNCVKIWLRNCLSNHVQCSAESLPSTKRKLPRRLLEINDADTVRLRTMERSWDLESVEYLALSHCWGSGPTLRLTSRSADMLRKGVEVSALSKTFQHAISVTRCFWSEFGVRYLWIDSLCIVQDSVADWRRESAIMGEIYQNAFCTLAATAAEDGSHGLFFDRDPREITPFAVTVTPERSEQKQFYIADPEDWTRQVSKSPLNRRAWVFQERILSPRVIHFTRNQLYWECSGLEASEAFCQGFPNGFGVQFKGILPFCTPSKHERRESTTRGPYHIWDHVMEMYSSGKLSRRTDRLVALSGIAHKLKRTVMPHDTYLAGLWRLDLPFELLWHVEETQIDDAHEVYIAPTWSWASRSRTLPCEESPWASADSLIDVISAAVTPVGKDPMGQVSHGVIRLSGLLVRGSLYRKYLPGYADLGIALKVEDQPVNSVICRPDDGLSFKLQLPYVVYCLPILHAVSQMASRPRYRGLLLVSSGREREFKRYGTFTAEISDDTFLSSSAPSTFETGALSSAGHYDFTIV